MLRVNRMELDDQPRKLNTKAKGSLTVLAFMYECGRRGAVISEPIGDHASYDLVLDNSSRLLRIQVKTSTRDKGKSTFTFNVKKRVTRYRGHLKGDETRTGLAEATKGYWLVPYKDDVDYIVTCAGKSWYIYQPQDLPNNNGYINPNKPHSAKDNWEALGLERQPVFRPD
jgi:PD-(D/E)XK endonuclease